MDGGDARQFRQQGIRGSVECRRHDPDVRQTTDIPIGHCRRATRKQATRNRGNEEEWKRSRVPGRPVQRRGAIPVHSIHIGTLGNRLYHSLLDAEGRDSGGNPDMSRHPNGGLAFLRRPITSASRERNGQNWSVPKELGHPLEDRKRIGRTSSQDPGVGTDDVIVATASLEVGFNDPTVGAVVQHKAPRDMAPFLQRKGRAGRPRGMRPWTVMVLSDYGRDRLCYRAYDRLFDPELGVRSIPLSSRYVRRIQATYALIDWLARSGQGPTVQGSVWTALSGPGGGAARNALVARLREAMNNPGAGEHLADHLVEALQISRVEVDALLWEYPRPLMTTVIPTALRRLERPSLLRDVSGTLPLMNEIDPRDAAWASRFFSGRNALRWASVIGGSAPDDWASDIAPWFAPPCQSDPDAPMVLPLVARDGSVVWYGVSRTVRGAHRLAEDLLAAVGPSYSDFTGGAHEANPGDRCEATLAEIFARPILLLRPTSAADIRPIRSAVARYRGLVERRPAFGRTAATGRSGWSVANSTAPCWRATRAERGTRSRNFSG